MVTLKWDKKCKSMIDKIPENDLRNTIPRLYFKQYIDTNLKETYIENSIIKWLKTNLENKEKIDICEERVVRNND